MNTKRLFFSACVLSLWAGTAIAFAQSASPSSTASEDVNPLPEKLVLRIPENTTATITAKRLRTLTPEEVNNPIRQTWKPDLISSTLIRRDGMLLVVNRWEGDKTSYVLVSKGHTLYQPSLKYPEDIQIDGQGAPDFSRGDFSNLWWVDREHFVKTETRNGRKVYMLDRQKRFGGEPSENEKRAEAEKAADAQGLLQREYRKAYIDALLARESKGEVLFLDAKTRLPLFSNDVDMEYTYSYGASTDAPLPVPPAFEQLLKARLQ